MINNKLKKVVTWLLIVAAFTSSMPLSFVRARAEEFVNEFSNDEDYLSPENEGDLITDEADDPQREALKTEPQRLPDALISEFKNQYAQDIDSGFGRLADTYYPTSKIVLSATDQIDIEQFYIIQSALPNLMTDLDELSALTGKMVEELILLRQEEPDVFRELIDKTTREKFSNEYLKSRILSDMDLLARLLRLSSSSAAINELNENRNNIISEIDQILEYKIDRKVIETLNYLVRPKDDPRGGAGHWRIRVARLRKNYTRDNTRYSRESNAVIAANQEAEQRQENQIAEQTVGEIGSHDTAQLEEDAEQLGANPSNTLASGEIQNEDGETISDFLVSTDTIRTNVSAHYKGQAIDIDEIDSIKCTKIERTRLGSDKKKALEPYNIKASWQTMEGYGKDQDAINNSFNSMMWNSSQASLLSMLSELDIDFADIESLDSANFSDLASTIGRAFFAQALNAPSGQIWNFPLEETLRRLGGVMIADKLGLDRAPFLDTSINSMDGITQAIGRAAIEKKLNLPYGTLKGNGRDEMLINAGKYRILSELRLPTDILDTLPENQEDLHQRIGSRLVETGLGLNKGSMYKKSSLSEVKDAAGKYKIEAILAMPWDLDAEFNLPTGSGLGLKNGSISIRDFNRRVATAALIASSHMYPNYNADVGSEQTPNDVGAINYRDEMFNLPEGTIDSFLNNTMTDIEYRATGIFSLARIFENGDLGRLNLAIWLNHPTENFRIMGWKPDPEDSSKKITGIVDLPVQTYTSMLGVSKNEVYFILGNPADGSNAGAFKRLGEKILFEAIRKSDMVQKATSEFLSEHPELQEGIEQYEFYKERIDNVRSHMDDLREKARELRAALEAIETTLMSLEDKQQVNATLDRIVSVVNTDPGGNSSVIIALATQIIEHGDSAAARVTQLNEIANVYADHPLGNLRSAINSFNSELEYIMRNAYEIVSGKEQSDFNLDEMRVGQMGFGQIELSGTSVSTMDFILLLTGRITPQDFFISLASAKIADELDLPPKALHYAAKLIKSVTEKKGNTKTAFFRAIGLAALEMKINQNSSSGGGRNEVANFSDNVADVGEAGTIQELRAELAESFGGNTERADSVIVSGLGMPGYRLEQLMRGDFGAWASARPKAEANDRELKLPLGTTENFIRGTSLSAAIQLDISDDDYRHMATKLGVSESSLRLFIAHANGDDNPAVNNIYYVDQNRYMISNDTEDMCSGKPIPDNVFMYYDQDGMHYFNSYPEANEYVRAHEDRKFGDYVAEISGRLWAIFSQDPGGESANSSTATLLRSQENIAAKLNAFIRGETSTVFNDPDTYDRARAYLFNALSIPTALSDKFFSRSSMEESIPENGKIDFLKTMGVALIKNFAVSYLGQSMGFNIGSTRITADDVYEIFNGNARQIFYRLGGSVLDQELDLRRGTFESILSAPNAASRECAMERAATQMLGEMLGIPGLRLEGSLFQNIGGGKMEQLLGFPEGSFRGANLPEMLNTNRRNFVPIIAFYKGFQLPVPNMIRGMAEEAVMMMGKDYIDRYKNASFYEQVEVLNNYIEALGDSSATSQLMTPYRQIQRQLIEYLPHLLKPELLRSADPSEQAAYLSRIESNIFAGYSRTSDQDQLKMARALNLRLSSIDSAAQQPSGSAIKLLLGEISPDDFRQATSRVAIEDIAVEAIKHYFDIETEINAGDLRTFKAALLGEDPTMNGNQRLSVIYTFLTKAFGWKFDEKAGFDPGTIASMIAEPRLAPALLMQAGARYIDRQWGIEDDRINFSRFVDIYWQENQEDVDYCNSQEAKSNPDTATLDGCLDRRRWSNVRHAARAEIEQKVANKISNFLTEMTKVDIEITADSSEGEHHQAGGVNLPLDYIYDIFKGDMRVLGVIATIRGISAVLKDNDGRFAMGPGSDDFYFIYQDVVYAYYGNPETENFAAQRAREQVYAENNTNNSHLYATYEANPEDTWNIPWASADSGVTNITAAPDSFAAVMVYSNLNYGVPAGAEITAPSEPEIRPEPVPDDFTYGHYATDDPQVLEEYNAAHEQWLGDHLRWVEENENYQRVTAEADQAATAAAANARQLHREYLEYRVMDCMLRKADSHIPAGFAWAIMKGNGFVRTAALLNYVEGWIRYDTDWGQYVPEGSLTAIWQYFDGPVGTRGNMDMLIDRTGAGVFGLVDDYLVEHSPKVFGLTFKPGTAQALFAFAKTGRMDQAVSIGGVEYSLATVYEDWSADFIRDRIGGWADKKLGLPPGSTFSAYQAITKINEARRMLSAARKLEAGKSLETLNANKKLIEAAKNMGIDPSKSLDLDQVAKLQSKYKQQVTNLKAEFVTLVITMVFSDQIADAEEAIGLVPGTGAMAVAMLVNYLMGASFSPVGAIMFVAINLFGPYKTEVLCTADGYYPEKTQPDSNLSIDNGHLGVFNGMNEKKRREGFIKAAQYKTDRLAQDLYEMPTLTGDKDLVPLQVMVGREETAYKTKPLVLNTACKKIGSSSFMKNAEGEELAICAGSYVGIWQNPQNLDHHHVGF